MNNSFEQYFKCPERYVQFSLKGRLSPTKRYFRFGEDAVCFGRYSGQHPSNSPTGTLVDAACEVTLERRTTYLPFDVDEVVDGLRLEQYVSSINGRADSALASMYYGIRPLLPISVRKYLQRLRLNGWDKIAIPRWPVDRTVDEIFEALMLLSLRSQEVDRIPFIWFWPEGASSCAIMTHDVETTKGKDFSTALMDIDDQFGIKASFQVVPERRYEVTGEYLNSITARGFEVGVQDLNHDGHLYRSKQQFISRAEKINSYGRQWAAKGFRGAVLYRRQEWFDALDFSYDMSVPNVAHLDPQRGGCCTVMPYFIGKLLELPVTTTQDYSLFHILRDYSIDLWKRQIELIMEKHGLISFIIHPDYITNQLERATYESLLSHLYQLREERNVWIPIPGDVDRWWRERANMRLVEDSGKWRIEGHGNERARVAYASEKNGRLEFAVEASAKTLARK
jgi:hypothetical protein